MPYLAQAFVRLRPSDDGFKADATAKVKAATAGLTATARITANTLAATADVDRLKLRLSAFSREIYAAAVKVKGGSEAELALARVALGLAKLDRTTASPKVTVEGLAAAEVRLLAFERVFSRLGRAQGIGRGAGGLGGLLGNVGGLIAGGGGAGGSAGPALITGGAGVGIALLESGIAGIIPLLASAAIGLGAFGALAIPTIGAVSSAFSGARTAVTNYQLASANLNIAIRKSPADWAAYQKTIHGLEPDFQAAAKLLTNQDVLWQNLSPSMQASVVALSNNKAALKLLLPDQRKALDALLAQKKAWDQLPAGQKPAISAMQQIGVVWSKMVAAFAPTVFKILGAGLKGVLALLPALLPFANAAAGAILQLATQFTKFASSPGFKAFLAQMLKLTGPAILAIGEGFGKIAVAVGKLLLAFINPNGIRALKLLFTIVAGFITGTAALFVWATPRVINNIHQLANAFNKTRHDVAAVLDWFRSAFESFRHRTAVVFDGIRGDIGHYWNMTWANTIGRAQHGIADARALFRGWWTNIMNWHNTARTWLGHIWDVIWNNTVGRAQRGAADVVSWFKGLPHRIVSALGNLGALLIAGGKAIIGGLLSGISQVMTGIGAWINNNVVQPLIHAVLHFFGIGSPSKVMIGIGKNLASSLVKGMIDHNPAKFVGRVFSNVGNAGVKVAEWALKKGFATFAQIPGDILGGLEKIGGFLEHLFGFGGGSGNVAAWIAAAMKITGVPASWAPLLGMLVSKESGGNPKAANLSPAGVAAGYPEGIAQVTIGTFAGSHLPGLNDIWNPVDNLVAGIRHILSAWGSIFNIPGLGAPGSYQGYATGGMITEPMIAIGRSGKMIALGERGMERVTPGDGSGGLTPVATGLEGQLAGIAAAIDGLAAALAGTAHAAALGAHAGAYRSYYGVR